MKRQERRVLINAVVMTASTLAALVGLIGLAWILVDVAIKGVSAIDWNFFTKLPSPPGEPGGGLANAIVGTLFMTGAAAAIAVPSGVAAGTWLSEFGKTKAHANVVRLISDILVSAPSIVVGVFVYLILVRPMGTFSSLAGAVALAIIMLPVVVRTTEEMLNIVPNEMREAALALGSPYWKMMISVLFRAARTGMVTGILLAIARVAGETAPLLFTALNSPYWSDSFDSPMGNLTVTLFNYAMSPYDDWHAMAWGAALLITASVLVLTIFTRIAVSAGRPR